MPSRQPHRGIRPVILLTFANDRYAPDSSYLRELVSECRAIREILEPDAAQRNYTIIVEQNLTQARFDSLLATHGDTLIGFHYGGHADSLGLHLEDEIGRPAHMTASDIAARLERAPRLRWVFLNGCTTDGHVDAIRNSTRAPIVATTQAIRDTIARDFATTFYGQLVSGGSIEFAFENARRTAEDTADRRGGGRLRLLRPAAASSNPIPWTLSVAPDDCDSLAWTLSAELAQYGLAGRLRRVDRQPLPRHALPSQLLHARHGIVPFVGRNAELRALDIWADDPAPLRVRLVAGPGGVGKTRLLIEWLSQRFEEAGASGFLDGPLDEQTYSMLVEAREATVIIDHAETRTELATLLARLAQSSQAGRIRRIRVVLIARHDGDWWQALTQHGGPLADLLRDSPHPLNLAPLVQTTDRRAEFERAVHAFAYLRGSGAGASSVPTDFADERFGRPLYLHMAALAAVEGLPPTAGALIGGMLEHEGRMWCVRAGMEDDWAMVAAFLPRARAFMGAVTLRGGIADHASAVELAQRFHPDGEALAVLMSGIYPAPNGGVAPLEPDLLGEALVDRLIEEATPSEWLATAIREMEPHGAVNAFLTLGRLEAGRPNRISAAFLELLLEDFGMRAQAAFIALLALGEQTDHSMLGQILAALLARTKAVPLAHHFDGQIPHKTALLGEVGAWVERTLIEEEVPLLESTPIAQAPDAPMNGATPSPDPARRLVGRYLRLAQHLETLGKPDAARSAADNGVSLLRLTERVAPGSSEGMLGEGLSALARHYGFIGQGASARRLDEEALHAPLPRANDFEAIAERARRLYRVGVSRVADGEIASGVEAIDEALRLARRCANHAPDAHRQLLADVWLARARAVSALGKTGDAVLASEKAVELRRMLAVERPDGFVGDLAESLVTLSEHLSACNDHARARGTADEAVTIYRRLARARSDKFSAPLAEALERLERTLAAVGQSAAAEVIKGEAQALRRTLQATQKEKPKGLAATLPVQEVLGEPKGWMWLMFDGKRHLVYGYVDQSAGPSAKGGEVGPGPTAEHVQALVERPSYTFRMPMGEVTPLDAEERERLRLPARPDWLQYYAPNGPWHADPRVRTHPDHTEDVQAVFMRRTPDGLGIEHAEVMWVRLTGTAPELDAYVGELLNQPHDLSMLQQGMAVTVRAADGAPCLVWVDAIVEENLSRCRAQCEACGFDLLLAPVQAQFDATFSFRDHPVLKDGRGARSQMFTTRCVMCGETQRIRALAGHFEVTRNTASVAGPAQQSLSATPEAADQSGHMEEDARWARRRPWWKFWGR